VAVAATAAVVEDFELAFRTGSADFGLAAWVRGFGFGFAGGETEEENGAALPVAAAAAAVPLSVSVLAKRGIRRLAMPLVGWGSLRAEKNAC
jgi:hypothetical protein